MYTNETIQVVFLYFLIDVSGNPKVVHFMHMDNCLRMQIIILITS